MLERYQAMPADQKAQYATRMKERGIDIEALAKGGAKPAARSRSGRAPSLGGMSGATTIDALFGPLPPRVSSGRVYVWLASEKKLKSVRLRLGVSDGQYTELLEGDLPATAELITAVTLGTESANRNPSQSSNPLMQQQRGGMRGPERPRRRRWRTLTELRVQAVARSAGPSDRHTIPAHRTVARSGDSHTDCLCLSSPFAIIKKTYVVGDIEVRALRHVSMDVEAGEFLAVTGPSGSGKSTFMHILGCLDRPTSGQYFLDGHDVSQTDQERAGANPEPPDRLRLPGIQPPLADDGARERRTAAALQQRPRRRRTIGSAGRWSR